MKGVYMLLLTRKEGQSIIIGDDIVLTIIYIDKRKVKIGISAPKGIQVNREEVFLYLKKNKDYKPTNKQVPNQNNDLINYFQKNS